MVIDHCSYDFFTISYWHLISDICTAILTLDPQLKKASKNRHFLGGKTQKKLAKFFLRLRDAYKKYILQKNGSKRSLEPSAVVNIIYLYGVATPN